MAEDEHMNEDYIADLTAELRYTQDALDEAQRVAKSEAETCLALAQELNRVSTELHGAKFYLLAVKHAPLWRRVRYAFTGVFR